MTARSVAFSTALLVAIGAVALAGAAPVKKRPATPVRTATAANDSDAVLVRVGGEPITRRMVFQRLEEIPEQYRTNYTTPEGRQQLLDRIVEERVWLLDAQKNGVADREAVRRQMEQQKRDLLIRTWVNEVMAANPAPSDSEAKIYYDGHPDDFRTPANVTLRHIQSKTEADARRVLALVRAKGANWDDLAKKWSADTTTRSNGGSLGTVTREGAFAALGMQPALAESAMALGDGRIGGPYKTDHGWHVIKVDTVHPETVRPYEQVRNFIMRQIQQTKTQDYYNEALGRAKSRLGVSPDSSAIKGFLSVRKSAREMFQEAQNAGGPEARIAAYRAVVAQFPDADVTPQAQFMTGFIYSEELKNFEEAEKAFRELLARYPKSELAASAQWMVEHMRTEDAPTFMNLEADSSAAKPATPKSPTAKH